MAFICEEFAARHYLVDLLLESAPGVVALTQRPVYHSYLVVLLARCGWAQLDSIDGVKRFGPFHGVSSGVATGNISQNR